ncbi:MAG: dihydroneopterin aldolase [bacterium]|nr:dihydroneopterin aldolase [bacterium]
MSDRIELRDIRAWGRHGADPGEKERPQPFDLDVALELDLSAAERSDALADTVDYAALHRGIVAIVETRSYDLLERLAAEIAALALADRRVRNVRVAVAKPRLLNGATPVVTLERGRPSVGPQR